MFHYKISHVETNQNNGKRTVSTTRAWVPFSGDEHLLANTKHFSLVCVCVSSFQRHGVMHHKFSHMRVVLREIDFPLRIFQQKSLNQKRKWLQHQQRAERDGQAAKVKREEMERLIKEQEEQEQERKMAAKKK